jgi:hypothetical protein
MVGQICKVKVCLLALGLLAFNLAQADSFRCGRTLVKAGESSNALIKKCGKPALKYSSKEQVNDSGKRSRLSVSNWVYERHGKKDMIVSVRNGSIVKIQRD